MYVLASQLRNLPIVSLQTGQVIAEAGKPIINPDKLEVVAFSCNIERFKRGTEVLLTRDVRQIAHEGIIIDSVDEIEDASDIVRLKVPYERKFDPIGAQVVNESGFRLGKVEEFTVNLDNFLIQKLYIKQSLLKNILNSNLVVDRTQIIDVTDRQITVRDASVKEPLIAGQPVVPDI